MIRCKLNSAFIKQLIIFIFVFGVSRFLPIIITPLLTNYFSINDMGTVELIIASYNILSIFGMFQVDSAVQRYFSSQSENKYITSLFFVIFCSFVSSCLFYVICGFFDYFNNTTVFVIILTSFSVNIFSILQVLLRYTYNNIIRICFISFLQVFLFFCFIFYAMKVETLNMYNYFYYLSISYVSCSLIVICLLMKKIHIKMELEILKEYFNFSAPLFPARLLSSFSQYGNRFIIALFLSSSSVAIFSVATKVSLAYSIILSAFNMVWYPIVYKDKDLSKAKDVFKYTILFMMFFSPLLCFLSYFYFVNFIDVQYIDGIFYSYVLIYSFSLYILKEMVETPIKIAEKTKIISLCYFFYMLLQFILMILTGKVFYLYGIVFSIYISNIFLVVITWFYSRKYNNEICDFKLFVLYLLSSFFCIYVGVIYVGK